MRHAHAIEERLAAAKADLAMIAAGRNAALRIGSFQTIGVHILPEVLSRFMEAWPEARIQLTESVNDLELAEAVRRGELDVAYVVLPLPAPDDALEVTDLLEDPFVFAAQAGSGVLRPDMLDSADGLKEIPLVCFQSCRATERVLRTLRTELGVEPRIVLRSDDNETLKGMAAAGAAVALFPGLSLEPHDSELDVVALPPKIGPRVISLVRRRDRWLTAPMTDFISLSVTVSREVHARTQAEPFGSAG